MFHDVSMYKSPSSLLCLVNYILLTERGKCKKAIRGKINCLIYAQVFYKKSPAQSIRSIYQIISSL